MYQKLPERKQVFRVNSIFSTHSLGTVSHFTICGNEENPFEILTPNASSCCFNSVVIVLLLMNVFYNKITGRGNDKQFRRVVISGGGQCRTSVILEISYFFVISTQLDIAGNTVGALGSCLLGKGI